MMMGPLSSTDDQPGIGVSTTVGRLFWRAVGRTRTVQVVVREREKEELSGIQWTGGGRSAWSGSSFAIK